MKRVQNIKKSVKHSLGTEQEAATLLAQKNYKKALDYYKCLLKQESCDKYRDAIRECYMGRVMELGKKGMYREAVVLWENHRLYCRGCNHVYLYIHLLLAAKLEEKAATVFVQNQQALSGSQSSQLEEIFAVLLLTGPSQLVSIFPEESILRRHLSLVNLAFMAMTEQNEEKMESTLTAISFRSPYKPLRLILQGCLLFLRHKDSALAVLERVPTSSFFYPLAHIAKLALSSPFHLAKSLPHLSQAEFHFLSGLQGWTEDLQKYLDRLRQLPHAAKPKIVFDLMVEGLPFIPQPTAKRLCYTLLPFYPPAIKPFEDRFGKLLPEEKARLTAWTSISQKQRPPSVAWAEYEKTLGSYQPQTPLIALKRAFALRHVVDSIDQEHGPDCRCPWSKRNLLLLEKSLELDPLDQPTYLQLIKHYRQKGDQTHYKKWADKASLVFPKERTILIAAIEAARHGHDGSPDHAIQLANQLLELDPINLLAKQYMQEFQLTKGRQFIVEQKWEEAKNLLQKLKSEPLQSLQLTIQLNEGLIAYQQGDLPAARLLIQSCDVQDVVVCLRLFIEANKLHIQLDRIEQAILSPLLPDNMRIQDKAHLLRLIDVMDQEGPGTHLKWKEMMDRIKKPLQKAAECPLTAPDLMRACECFTKLRQFKWIPVFVNKQPHLKGDPIFIYYTINAKLQGNPKKMKSSDSRALEKALDKAEGARDRQATLLIHRLLEEAHEEKDFFSREDFYEAIEELMEEFHLKNLK